uniref:3-methyl-2-oxobutanoate hydroxymethyltransferase n=1 Tax=Meloidogyne javanica TaxID=6303 RepID=A0A915MVI1_MELJA
MSNGNDISLYKNNSNIPKLITIPKLHQMKKEGIPIVSLTAYDYSMGKEMDQAGVDVILIGDSLGCVIQGKQNTLSVKRVLLVKRALLVADLPFSCSYSVEKVIESSVSLLSKAGAAAVKLEIPSNSELHLKMLRELNSLSIPVFAHIGLTPQSVHSLGKAGNALLSGYQVQGNSKSKRTAEELLELAIQVEKCGASAVVLECVTKDLVKQITDSLKIPTIGIGAAFSRISKRRPIIFVHGLTNVAGTYEYIRRYFLTKGYNNSELYATTYSYGVKKFLKDKMECRHITQIRLLIEAVSRVGYEAFSRISTIRSIDDTIVGNIACDGHSVSSINGQDDEILVNIN